MLSVRIQDLTTREVHVVAARTALASVLSEDELKADPTTGLSVEDGEAPEPADSLLTVDALDVGEAGYVWDEDTGVYWLSRRLPDAA